MTLASEPVFPTLRCRVTEYNLSGNFTEFIFGSFHQKLPKLEGSFQLEIAGAFKSGLYSKA